jgi:Flp pilus assembly pilin Flp
MPRAPRPPLAHALGQACLALVATAAARLGHASHPGARDDRGQATTEYGLVILAAGGIALGVIAWASRTGSFTGMFEAVLDKLTGSL